ncbi:MAG TPA: response regulator [Pyrinomonadaceae bacterium]|nr:response regulator [Pyrinomonadaceae bacterium]
MSGNELTILIADDERPAREYIKKILSEMDAVEVIGEAADGSEAVELINKQSPDLALIDLQMPEMTGLELIAYIAEEKMPLIAFVTAYDEYAIKAFEANAIDYLLKPVEKARLAKTIQRAKKLKGNESARLENQKAISRLRFAPIRRLPVKNNNDEVSLLPVSEIEVVIADGELLKIHTNDKQKHYLNYRIKDLEERLDQEQFFRISRGTIVNLDYVEKMSPLPGGTFEILLKSGIKVLSSRNRSKVLRERLLKL